MAQKILPNGYLQDAAGRLVPIDMIKAIDLSRDELVHEIVQRAQGLAAQIAAFRTQTMGDVESFVALSAEQYGVHLGGIKGNVQLMSFDGRYRVTRSIQDRLTFDERLQAAKALIDECITAWSEGSRAEIRVLVNAAFQVDKEGKINTGRVLGLRRLEITDERWKRAMQAIGDAVQVVSSKAYLRIYERDDAGEYQMLNLDAA